MQSNINNMLGQIPEDENKNPLEKIDEASKEAGKKPEPDETKAESFDEETFKQILMAGDNTEGLFKPEIKEDEKNPNHAEVDEDAKIKQGEVSKPKGKYVKKFKEDISKNPQDYKVQTPKGEMTIAEAMRKGYNPITKRFEKEKSADAIKEKHLSGLNDADKSKLEELTNPAAAHIAPKDAEAMGLPGDSPMVDGNTPPQPAMPVAPEGQAPAEGGPDIASLLGGIK